MTEIHDAPPMEALEGMLPVGMLTQGGAGAEAMAAVAQRKRGQPGWEAFHYEKISASEFEITGGLVSLVGGVKKWAGPHETLQISAQEILQEMQVALGETGDFSPTLPAAAEQGRQTPPPYLQVRLRLPDDAAARQRVLQAFRLEADISGATVLACALQD